MRRLIFVAALLASVGISAGYSATKGLVCSLTGKHIDECCCQQKDGKLYCPLADKTIDNCCCDDAK